MESCFSEKAKEYLKEWKPVKEAFGHRPFNPEAEEYKEFMNRARQRAKALELKYGPSSVKEETTL